MVLEFEEQVLKYLVQNNSKKYIDLLDPDIFEDVNTQVIFTIIKGYYNEYNKQPSKPDLLEYTKRMLIQNNYENDDIRIVTDEVRFMFNPFGNSTFTKDIIITEAQKTLTKTLLTESAADLETSDENYFKNILKKMADIVAMADDDITLSHVEKGKPVLSHGIEYQDIKSMVCPTVFKGLNKTMGAGGVMSPHFIALMGGAKAFKTGILLTLTKGFVKSGKKVLYCDGENGLYSIQNRFIQSMTRATFGELMNDRFYSEKFLDKGSKNSDFKDISYKDNRSIKKTFKRLADFIYKNTKGNLVIHSYTPATANMANIDIDIQELVSTYGFKPDVLIFDDLSHFIPVKKQASDTLDSQQCIKEVYGLNKRWGTFSITPAQINRQGYKKEKFDATDIGRDIGIYKYATAIWGIQTTPEEEKRNMMRLYVVAQREGFGDILASYLLLDKPTMQVKEITLKEGVNMLGTNPKNKKLSKKDKKDLTDN